MSNPSPYMQGWLASERLAKDKIEVKRVYIDINDGNLYDGILFSQIVYWHGFTEDGRTRLRVERDGYLWLAKTYADWWEEVRIEERQAKACIQRLKRRGLIETAVYKFNSFPTVHIRLNHDALQQRVIEYFNTLENSKSDQTSDVQGFRHQMSKPSDTKCPNHQTPNVQSLTETTNRNYNQKLQTNKEEEKSAPLSKPKSAKQIMEERKAKRAAAQVPQVEVLPVNSLLPEDVTKPDEVTTLVVGDKGNRLNGNDYQSRNLAVDAKRAEAGFEKRFRTPYRSNEQLQPYIDIWNTEKPSVCTAVKKGDNRLFTALRGAAETYSEEDFKCAVIAAREGQDAYCRQQKCNLSRFLVAHLGNYFNDHHKWMEVDPDYRDRVLGKIPSIDLGFIKPELAGNTKAQEAYEFQHNQTFKPESELAKIRLFG